MRPDEIPAPIRALLTAFEQGVRAALGDDLVALYIFGSLCMGDFDARSSDIDFLGIHNEPLTADRVAALEALHRGVARTSVWGDRLEGGYALQTDLRSWGIAGPIAAVEPGEPLRPAAPADYSADNMLAIRLHGLALHGPPAATLLPPVDAATLTAGLRAYLGELLTYPAATAPVKDAAAWTLNVARCLYGIETATLATKAQAAQWLGAQAPSVRSVLDSAYRLRAGSGDTGLEDRLRTGVETLHQVATRWLEHPGVSAGR